MHLDQQCLIWRHLRLLISNLILDQHYIYKVIFEVLLFFCMTFRELRLMAYLNESRQLIIPTFLSIPLSTLIKTQANLILVFCRNIQYLLAYDTFRDDL